MELSILTAVWALTSVVALLVGFKMILIGIDILRTDKVSFRVHRKLAGSLKQQLIGEMPNDGYSSAGIRSSSYARGVAIDKATGHLRLIGRLSNDTLKENLR